MKNLLILIIFSFGSLVFGEDLKKLQDYVGKHVDGLVDISPAKLPASLKKEFKPDQDPLDCPKAHSLLFNKSQYFIIEECGEDGRVIVVYDQKGKVVDSAVTCGTEACNFKGWKWMH